MINTFILENISDKYKCKLTEVIIGDLNIKLNEITNFDELFDELAKSEEQSHQSLEDYIPYWTELWPSAIALSQYIREHKYLVIDSHVLELGCGLGLPSLVCALCDARKTTATDLIDDSLHFVKQNALLNQISFERFNTQILDWTKVDVQALTDYDIIIAADIVYEKRFVNHFIDFIHKISNHQKSIKILLTEPGRQIASDLYPILKNINGVTIETSKMQIDSKGTPFGINIFKIILGADT